MPPIQPSPSAALTILSYDDPSPAQIGRDLAAAAERVFGEHAVDLLHHLQPVRVNPERYVAKRGSARPEQTTLLTDALIEMVTLDQSSLYCRAHLLSPSDIGKWDPGPGSAAYVL